MWCKWPSVDILCCGADSSQTVPTSLDLQCGLCHHSQWESIHCCVPIQANQEEQPQNSAYRAVHAVYVCFTAESSFLLTLLPHKTFSCVLDWLRKAALQCPSVPCRCVQWKVPLSLIKRITAMPGSCQAGEGVKYTLLTPSPHSSLKHRQKRSKFSSLNFLCLAVLRKRKAQSCFIFLSSKHPNLKHISSNHNLLGDRRFPCKNKWQIYSLDNPTGAIRTGADHPWAKEGQSEGTSHCQSLQEFNLWHSLIKARYERLYNLVQI